MSVDVKYRTTATATGGRDGHAATKDGTFDVKLATPKELGGAGGPGNNPEQLFASGYSACFLGAMKFVASQGGPRCQGHQCHLDGRHRPALGGWIRARRRDGNLTAGHGQGGRRRRWLRRRIRFAPTPTPSAAM